MLLVVAMKIKQNGEKRYEVFGFISRILNLEIILVTYLIEVFFQSRLAGSMVQLQRIS